MGCRGGPPLPSLYRSRAALESRSGDGFPVKSSAETSVVRPEVRAETPPPPPSSLPEDAGADADDADLK